MPPSPTLSRFQLASLMLALVLIPFSFVIGMALFLKSEPEPKLNAEIELKIDAWTPPGATPEEKSRLIELLVLRNPTRETWRNVSVSLNEQFFFYHHLPLASGESLTIPLSLFVTKSGSVAFRPATQKISLVTVFAQLPSGERAVFEKEIEQSNRAQSPTPP